MLQPVITSTVGPSGASSVGQRRERSGSGCFRTYADGVERSHGGSDLGL